VKNQPVAPPTPISTWWLTVFGFEGEKKSYGSGGRLGKKEKRGKRTSLSKAVKLGIDIKENQLIII